MTLLRKAMEHAGGGAAVAEHLRHGKKPRGWKGRSDRTLSA
jgi:hypothetical protein